MMNSNDLLNIQGDMGKAMQMQQQAKPAMSMPKLNPMELVRLIISKWYWFVLSLAVCLGVAWYLLHSASPVYMRTVSVLIKDKGTGTRLGAEASTFSEVSGLGISASLANEIEMFKTERLNEEVVHRLHLEVSYLEKESFHYRDLYGMCPVSVEFNADAKPTGSFMLAFLQNGKIRLEQFSAGEGTVEGELDAPLNTPMGVITVHPTECYKKEDNGRNILVSRQDPKNLATAYSVRVNAEMASKDASIVNLSLADASAKRAEDYLNTLVEVYKEDMINDKNKVAIDTDRFINERLAILEQDLGGVDGAIASFKQQNKMTDVMSEAGIASGRSTQLEQEGYQLESQMQLVKYIKKYLTDATKSEGLIPANTGVADVNLEGQITEYNKLLLERDRLMKNGGASNPVVQDMTTTLEQTRESILRSVDNVIASLNIKMKHVQDLEARSAKRLSAVPEHEKFMLSVERQQKVKEQLYVYLLQKREENALSRSLTESNARLIEAAKGPKGPISPNSTSYYLAGTLAGVGIPLLYLILALLFDNKVRSRKDIEENSTLPFLGDIPFRKTPKGQAASTLVVKADGTDMVTEAFRLLRTNLSFMKRADRPEKVLMATSMNPDAGKTFVLANLAATMVFAKKRVLLIDLDVRKGSLTRVFGGRREQGVTHYLSGHVTSPAELIHSVKDYPGLDIIYRGIIPPNPAELLLSNKLDELLEYVKPLYDIILIDSVPVGMVADASIVNRLVDRTLFIARAGRLDRRQLPDIERIYQEGKMTQASLVLNSVKEAHAGYGHYGYYGYGYGYGYHEHAKHTKN